VNCLRTDLKADDFVVVRMNSKGANLRLVTVTRLEFLNWNCVNTIECLAAEAEIGPNGIALPPDSPVTRGMARLWDLCDHLQRAGWIPRRPNNRAFKIAYSSANGSSASHIFVRSNGIDIQVLRGCWEVPPSRFSSLGFAPSAGPTVRHFLSQSGVNILELVARFATAFADDRRIYDEFFTPLGTSSKVTSEMRRRLLLREDDEDRGFDGSGGDVYICDGLSTSSSGRWIND
jgi:hypothetical protein